MEKRSGGDSRIAPSTGSMSPWRSTTSVPKDQPTSHGCGSPSSRGVGDRGAQVARPRPSPASNAPSLVPAALVVPRVLNRSTAMPASAGRRHAALRNRWLSIMPPCVGSGCRHTIVATGSRSSGERELADEAQPVGRRDGERLTTRRQHAVRDDLGHGAPCDGRSRWTRAVDDGVSVADRDRAGSRDPVDRVRSSTRCASAGGPPRPRCGPRARRPRAACPDGSPGRSRGSGRSSSRSLR